ncbi:hypothetical protein [Streptomyces violaceusniger]|uniref:Uncharacterized protein n=1 Tax=Streptomyces violaceusniger (strain Tu 4113) TaxID=653045 RepID=G2PHQ9_STRV4|nr:hypothetical protein [Streptomyces violaceusniger]AEM88860.1 hypothetical protein Strvi_0084 [Streptomyces violaceusniger Tu 4113]
MTDSTKNTTDNTGADTARGLVMPSVPSPQSTAEEITALDALHFGWNHRVMREIDRQLSFMGGLPYEPDARQRAALRAWVTATDERIADAVYCTEQDPQGFAFVAREVTALDDRELLARYEERKRETATARYQVRAVDQVPAAEREWLRTGFEGAAERYADSDSERPALYRAAAEGFRDVRGFVIWDRFNHRYVATQWGRTAEETAPECDRLNQYHERHFAADLWR